MRIGDDTVDGIRVSTIKTQYFTETMTFEEGKITGQWKYLNPGDASRGHEAIVEAIKNGQQPWEIELDYAIDC